MVNDWSLSVTSGPVNAVTPRTHLLELHKDNVPGADWLHTTKYQLAFAFAGGEAALLPLRMTLPSRASHPIAVPPSNIPR